MPAARSADTRARGEVTGPPTAGGPQSVRIGPAGMLRCQPPTIVFVVAPFAVVTTAWVFASKRGPCMALTPEYP